MNIPQALSNQNGVKRKVHTKKKKKGFITANVAGTKYEIGRKNDLFIMSNLLMKGDINIFKNVRCRSVELTKIEDFKIFASNIHLTAI